MAPKEGDGMQPPWEDGTGGWLCWCGAWMDHDFHCDSCGVVPPWGCECCEDEDSDDDDDDDGEDWEDIPY